MIMAFSVLVLYRLVSAQQL